MPFGQALAAFLTPLFDLLTTALLKRYKSGIIDLTERTRQGLPTWLFLSDAAKAFDTVWRDGMLDSLWEIGVRGRLWRIIRNLYPGNASRVLVDGQKSEVFPIEQGVAQGDPLPPTLYAIFQNALLQELQAGHSMEGSLQKGILELLYAENLVGISFTAYAYRVTSLIPAFSMPVGTGIGQMCPSVKSWSVYPLLSVQGLPARTYTWGQMEIPVVLQYKHLGITITPDGRLDMHIRRSSPRAMRACCRWAS